MLVLGYRLSVHGPEGSVGGCRCSSRLRPRDSSHRVRWGVVGRGARSPHFLAVAGEARVGGVAPMPPGSTSLRTGAATESGHELTERRCCWARAYRDGEL